MNSETATIAGLLALLALDRSCSPFSIQLLVAQAYSAWPAKPVSPTAAMASFLLLALLASSGLVGLGTAQSKQALVG